MIVVADAGPLIALAQINHLDLLHSLYAQIRIPPAVRHEVAISGRGRPGATKVDAVEWIRVVEVTDTMAVQFLREQLDAGESEAIVLAIEMEADLLLIDETRGRRVAESRGVNKTGTLGTLITAKRRGLIPSVSALLDDLMTSGFHMSEELHETVLELAGEK